MTVAAPLQLDVPCARCGYDLRGLTPPGKCPECAFDLDESIRLARGASTVPPIDPRWRRHMIDVAWFGLLTFAISAAIGILDASQRNRPYESAEIRFGGAAVVWAFSWWASWISGRLETIEKRKAGPRVMRALVRGFSTGFLITAALMVWMTTQQGSRSGFEPWRAGHSITAVGACVCFYLRIRQIALRLGRDGLSGQALMLAVLSPTVMYLLALSGEMTIYVSSLAGWSGAAANVIRSFRSWRNLQNFAWLAAWPGLLSICQIALMIQLLVHLSKARTSAGEYTASRKV